MEIKNGFVGFDYMDELVYDEPEYVFEGNVEIETLPEENSVPRCLICLHQIRHPICERCHIKEFEAWMVDKGIPGKLMKKIIGEISYESLFESEHEGYCIKCQKEVPNICSYCFFYKSARILKDNLISRDLISDFLHVFNYRQYNEDYVL